MIDYNFKKFVSRGTRAGNYSISLNASLMFGFNSGFYEKENIRNYKKVILYYDNQNSSVAFQFTNDEHTEGAFTVIHSKDSNSGSVTARSFIRVHELNKKEYYGKKVPKKINYKGIATLYVIDLTSNNANLISK